MMLHSEISLLLVKFSEPLFINMANLLLVTIEIVTGFML